MEKDFPIFRNYLEEEDDKPYFTVNSLAYYYEDMERKQKLINDMSKLILGYDNKLNLNLVEMEKRVAAELGKWDGKVEELPETVNGLLTAWAEDGTLSSVIDSTIVEEKMAPVIAQLAETKKKQQNYIDVKADFNAKGDNLTDDTLAFHNAIAFAVTNKIKRIRIPSGQYRVNLSVMDDNLLFEGDGSVENSEINGGTILSPFDKKKPCVTIADGVRLLGYVTFTNLSIHGDGISHTQSDGVVFNGAYSCYFDKVHFYNFGRDNIVFQAPGTQHNFRIYFDNVVTDYANGACINNKDNWGGITFTNFSIVPRQNPDSYAIKLTGNGASLQMSSGYIDWYDGHGILTTGATAIFCANVIWDFAGNGTGLMITTDRTSDTGYMCLQGVYNVDVHTIQYADKTVTHSSVRIPDGAFIDYPTFAHLVTLTDKFNSTVKATMACANNGELQFRPPNQVGIYGNTNLNTLNVQSLPNGNSTGVRFLSNMIDGVLKWARLSYNAQSNKILVDSSNGAVLDLGVTPLLIGKVAALPVADVSNRGQILRVEDASNGDKTYQCRYKGTVNGGGYEWKQLDL